VIGLAGFTFGVAVKAESKFKTIGELIEYAKANPGKLRYGAFPPGSTQHLVMEELGQKTSARFLMVPGSFAENVRALTNGSILAISDSTAWGPYVDAGTFRLLMTFGERRTRWNAPTAKELGFGVVAYSPFGLVAPKGMDPARTRVLHDAFNRTLDDPAYAELLQKHDMVDWYKSSEDYTDWAVDQFKFQKALIERTIGLGRN
jgi:tripartite-type tricarboxylate transporter receptor subunit TctC